MTFVIDASVTVSWLLPDEAGSGLVARKRAAQEDMIVPPIFWFEIRNAMLTAERRNRIAAHDTSLLLDRLSALPIKVAERPAEMLTLDLARAHRLSFYDAVYLELARRMRMPLATLDQRLALAAKAEGVELVGEQND